jgi:hypothetical protein
MGQEPPTKTSSQSLQFDKTPSGVPARLFPRELDQLLEDIDSEIIALRNRRTVGRELSPEEKTALDALLIRRRVLREQKYGVTIPPDR